MNKKADLSMTIKIGIGLVLGVMILIFSLTVGNKFLSIFFQDPAELTEKSLNTLETIINNLEEGESTSQIIKTSEGFYIVVFEKDPNKGSGIIGYYDRPSNECFQSSCIVLCRASTDNFACMGSESVRIFDFDKIETKEPGNPDAGIITYVEGESVNMYIAISNNNLILKEIANEETIEELNEIYGIEQ